MAARKEEINLLPSKAFEASIQGKIFSWVLSTFRIIVITTEIIVMIAFISRFFLDTQNTDLSEEIKEKKASLQSYSQFEKEFRDVQKRLAVFSEITKNEELIPKTIKNITSLLPPDLYLTSVSLREDAVEIEGSTPNEKSVQQLVTNLSSTDNFDEINIVELKSNLSTPTLLDFKLSTKIKLKS